MLIPNPFQNLNAKVSLRSENIAIVTDSFIARIVYGKQSGNIKITFSASNETYLYKGTTRRHFDEMIRAKSVGGYFTKNIRNNSEIVAELQD